jgi:AraC-like DNA-binding protein
LKENIIYHRQAMGYGYHHAQNINHCLLNMKFIIFAFDSSSFGDALGDVCRCFSIQPFFVFGHSNSRTTKAKEYLEHLLQVLFDQLKQAPAYSHYLPQSTHPTLAPILDQLANPELFHMSLQQVLYNFTVSERHVLRLSQQELQLSLSEWRNRAKIIFAINQIRQGMTIKQLAYTLGYHHSSSFIEFFKRYTGQTPIQLKNASI